MTIQIGRVPGLRGVFLLHDSLAHEVFTEGMCDRGHAELAISDEVEGAADVLGQLACALYWQAPIPPDGTSMDLPSGSYRLTPTAGRTQITERH